MDKKFAKEIPVMEEEKKNEQEKSKTVHRKSFYNPMKSELSDNQKLYLKDIYTHPTFIRDFQ